MAAEQERTHTTLRGALGGMRLRLGALAATGAALGAALALALGGPGGAGLSLGEAAAVTLRPATLPAPSENHHARAQLTASVDGIAFPYWEDRFGWRTTGAREDSVDGRHVRTVFYTDGKGRRVGYAIVAGQPAPQARPRHGPLARRHALPPRLRRRHACRDLVARRPPVRGLGPAAWTARRC